MVDSREAMESEYLTADLVKNSPSKMMVIVGEGNYKEMTYDNEIKRKLTIPVEIDSKRKTWLPNKDSVHNLQTFGPNTADWVNKMVKLEVMRVMGKDSVIARPLNGDSTNKS